MTFRYLCNGKGLLAHLGDIDDPETEIRLALSTKSRLTYRLRECLRPPRASGIWKTSAVIAARSLDGSEQTDDTLVGKVPVSREKGDENPDVWNFTAGDECADVLIVLGNGIGPLLGDEGQAGTE